MDVRIEHEQGRHLAVTRFEADLGAMAERMGAAFGTVRRHWAGRGSRWWVPRWPATRSARTG